jgi:hypothetical protein
MKVRKGKLFDIFEFYVDVHFTNQFMLEDTLRKIIFKIDYMEYEEHMKELKSPKPIIKYRIDLNDPRVERINKRKMWEEINSNKLLFLAEIYRRMNQNISTFNFKSRATELEYLDIRNNCEPINETEKKQAKTITTIYDAKKDNTILKLMEWNGQY